MKLIQISVFFFLSTFSFAQDRLIDKLAIGDTLTIYISRIGDRFGPYDQDSLLIVRTLEFRKLYSKKRNEWFMLDKKTIKKLRELENKGLKKTDHSLHYDIYTLRLKEKTSTFELNYWRLDKFMTELKPLSGPTFQYK
jgi:hypothetical protein